MCRTMCKRKHLRSCVTGNDISQIWFTFFFIHLIKDTLHCKSNNSDTLCTILFLSVTWILAKGQISKICRTPMNLYNPYTQVCCNGSVSNKTESLSCCDGAGKLLTCSEFLDHSSYSNDSLLVACVSRCESPVLCFEMFDSS
jgi:hypothetical protein